MKPEKIKEKIESLGHAIIFSNRKGLISELEEMAKLHNEEPDFKGWAEMDEQQLRWQLHRRIQLLIEEL